ncbi:MAG: WD40 repeat domain-containing protein, partial [Phaeodactylibacter sp.]|nr:WD40 repeat domain-containing protein [Phaeodactylibacter sp.]
MPSTTPILTLNTEMHTAMIRHISTDRRGRYLLACSRDKTAKLWELASGELLRTFRPPVGEAQEGMLYACALSPDGQTVAVGGWSAKNDIYIFDATSGLLQHRITGLPNVIFSLEYSPDGRFLAAALGGKNGIRIYNSHDYTQQAGDTDYGADSYNLAFDAWGRLATVCWDGHVRLYDNDFKLIKKAATKAGKMPFSIAFSPDTHLLAVGFEDSPIIQVLDAKTMGVLYEPDIEGVNDNGGMDILSFSADGARLAAGGAYQQNKEGKWWRQIRIWEKAGKGSWTDYNAGGNTIMDIKPLPHGGFVFGGAKPDWGIIDPDEGRRSLYRKGEVNEYRSKDRSHFRLGPGGTEVGVTPSNQSPLMFSIQGRQLSKTASRHPAASSEQGSLKVEDWKNQYSPKLNGKPLSFLDEYERCRSVDIATGGQGIAVGTEWKVRCTDAGGRLRWTQPVQGGAFCVKIDAYNEVVAAALDDGTIRWFRFLDGQPLLSLYLHPDDERWVLWTPSGYYDAAPGAENLIGWHVNNGEDKEASYYPISKFRQTYHRP